MCVHHYEKLLEFGDNQYCIVIKLTRTDGTNKLEILSDDGTVMISKKGNETDEQVGKEIVASYVNEYNKRIEGMRKVIEITKDMVGGDVPPEIQVMLDELKTAHMLESNALDSVVDEELAKLEGLDDIDGSNVTALTDFLKGRKH